MMSNVADKSVRRKPRVEKTYPTFEAFVEAKVAAARKKLEGVDLSFLKDKTETTISKTPPHSPL